MFWGDAVGGRWRLMRFGECRRAAPAVSEFPLSAEGRSPLDWRAARRGRARRRRVLRAVPPVPPTHNASGVKTADLCLCLVFLSQRLAAVPARGFAAGGKPAIQLFGVSGRYATALYQAGAGNLAGIEGELRGIAAMRSSDARFELFISDPTLSNTMKKDTITAIMAKGGYSQTTEKFLSASSPPLLRLPRAFSPRCRAGALTLSELTICRRAALFTELVIENRRLGDLTKITDDFLKLTAADRSELSAVVKTAIKLTPKQEKALQAALTKHPAVGNGVAVSMTNTVDSGIIGGLVVEVEDGGVTRVIDLSAKKKLSELKQLLAA